MHACVMLARSLNAHQTLTTLKQHACVWVQGDQNAIKNALIGASQGGTAGSNAIALASSVAGSNATQANALANAASKVILATHTFTLPLHGRQKLSVYKLVTSLQVHLESVESGQAGATSFAFSSCLSAFIHLFTGPVL